VMHFSMNSAIGDMLDVESVPLEEPDYPRSADVLAEAIIVFGMLLEKTEAAVRHGLAPPAVERFRQLLDDLSG